MEPIAGEPETIRGIRAPEMQSFARLRTLNFRILASLFRRSRVAENLSNRVSSLETRMLEQERMLKELEQRADGFVRNEIIEIFGRLSPFTPLNSNFIRCGNPSDGGYILVDDFKPTDVIFSIGVGDDISFDTEIEHQVQSVVMVDNTVPDFVVPIGKFHFFDQPLVSTDEEDGVTLSWLLRTFPADDHILKIDIEGAEWKVLADIPLQDLNSFRQIGIEFHGLTKLIDPVQRQLVSRVLDRLLVSHAPVLLHANNCADFLVVGGIAVADVIEVTWLRRDTYSLVPGLDPLIPPLFHPNTTSRIDIGNDWFFEILRLRSLASSGGVNS